jgi:hypothetical protein
VYAGSLGAAVGREQKMSLHIARVISMLCCGGLAAGCSTTPLDAVIAEDSGAPSGGSAADAGPCFSVAPGRFVLKSALNGQCLGAGSPTSVFGNPAFETAFAPDCTLPAQAWDALAAGSSSVFSFQNVASGDNLDVKMAGMQSGTPVIIYPATGLDNQKFEARARSGSSYELRPQHTTASCIVAMGLSTQIAPCASSDAAQAWQIERRDCL